MNLNQIRVNRAEAILSSYVLDNTLAGDEGSRQEQIIDVIVDLLHLAQKFDLNPEQILVMSEIHFNAEKER